jgi:hypothetical protein
MPSSLGAACHIDQPKSEKLSYSKLLLTKRMEQNAGGFQWIITGDELWFFRYYSRDSVCAASRDELPQYIEHKINTSQCLVSILWLVNGIHSFLDVPKGTMYNTALFSNAVVPSLIENVQWTTLRKTLKDGLIHMDHGPSHHSGRAQKGIKASRAERLPHPAYSPDPVPSDFFGYIKRKLSDYNCESREDHLNGITEIFTGVDQEMLLRSLNPG